MSVGQSCPVRAVFEKVYLAFDAAISKRAEEQNTIARRNGPVVVGVKQKRRRRFFGDMPVIGQLLNQRRVRIQSEQVLH